MKTAYFFNPSAIFLWSLSITVAIVPAQAATQSNYHELEARKLEAYLDQKDSPPVIKLLPKNDVYNDKRAGQKILIQDWKFYRRRPS